MTETMPEREALLDGIGGAIRWAYHLADNTEDNGETLTVTREDFDKLSAALDVLEAWPDEPGYTCGPAASAQWAIKQHLARPAPAEGNVRESIAEAIWFAGYGQHRLGAKWPDDVQGNSQDLFRKMADEVIAALSSPEDATPAEAECPDCGLPHPESNPYCFCRPAAPVSVEERAEELVRRAEEGARKWAVEKWDEEVANRPLQNVHRRALDDTWRQVVRRFGGDDEALLGPRHDDLLAQQDRRAAEESGNAHDEA